MMTASHIVLEAMKKRHVRAVRSIDKQVYSQPWSTSIYHEELRRRDKRVYYVAYHEGQIAGYGGAMIVHDEGHITSIAVHPEAQGLGIAKRLLVAVHRSCLDHPINAMTLEVRLSNERAQHLYRRFGYVPAGIRAGYYRDNNEDALIMWCNDIQKPAHAALLHDIETSISGSTDWGQK